MDMGAVGGLRHIKNAIGVAKYVLDYTAHSFLVGSSATEFAVQMGFPQENLTTNYSSGVWHNWTQKNCQPNFWKVKIQFTLRVNHVLKNT